MATKKKTTKAKKTGKSAAPKKSAPVVKKTVRDRGKAVVMPFKRAVDRQKRLRPRSPHRSFRRTYRRDYARSLEMPGYIAFTVGVWRELWQRKAIFLKLILVYAIASGFLVGLASQNTYMQISDLLQKSSGEVFGGDMGRLGEAGLLVLVSLSGGLNPSLTDTQQLISGLLVLLSWLTTVWLLRAFLAGHSPRLRDGFYNSGAPLIPTFILSVVLALQLIPAALATIGISAALPTGLINEGIEGMLFWVAMILLILLSLYWMVSTAIALVIITLPGMYPLNALKTAHELVAGRRLRIVLRIVWLMVVTLIAWVVVMISFILFDAWLKGLWPAVGWLPIVPLALLCISSASVVWAASYIYLLYRKVVDDDAAPA